MFHDCLPAYLSKDIESIQWRAMTISFPSLSYKEALDEAGLISLSVRRQSLTDKLFTKVTTGQGEQTSSSLAWSVSKTQTSKTQTLFKTLKYNKIIKYFVIYLLKLCGLTEMTLPCAQRGEFLKFMIMYTIGSTYLLRLPFTLSGVFSFPYVTPLIILCTSKHFAHLEEMFTRAELFNMWNVWRRWHA